MRNVFVIATEPKHEGKIEYSSLSKVIQGPYILPIPQPNIVSYPFVLQDFLVCEKLQYCCFLRAYRQSH